MDVCVHIRFRQENASPRCSFRVQAKGCGHDAAPAQKADPIVGRTKPWAKMALGSLSMTSVKTARTTRGCKGLETDKQLKQTHILRPAAVSRADARRKTSTHVPPTSGGQSSNHGYPYMCAARNTTNMRPCAKTTTSAFRNHESRSRVVLDVRNSGLTPYNNCPRGSPLWE